MKIYHPQSYTSFIIHTYAHSYYFIYLKNTATSILVVFPSFLLDHYLWGEQAAIFEQLYEEGFMVRTWNLQLAPERMEALPKITSGSIMDTDGMYYILRIHCIFSPKISIYINYVDIIQILQLYIIFILCLYVMQ